MVKIIWHGPGMDLVLCDHAEGLKVTSRLLGSPTTWFTRCSDCGLKLWAGVPAGPVRFYRPRED